VRTDKRVVIEIRTSTPAFGDDDNDAGHEVGRILHSIQTMLSVHGLQTMPPEMELRDWDGKVVGHLSVALT
jgi:hypothetical protein